MTQAVADTYDSLARAHGASKSLARTVLESESDGAVIVSTVILAVGRGINGDPFVAYETRVFGGRRDGHNSWNWSIPGLDEGFRTAILRHTEAITLVVDSYLTGDFP